MPSDWVWAIGLAVLGAIVGSFLATIAVRWPRGDSVLRGRSVCDACGQTLRWWELVPLASAMASRGRCRTCGAAIDARHGWIEAGCAAIGLVSGLAAAGPAGLAGAVFGWLLLTLAAIDLAELWLPDALTGTLAAVGIVAGLAGLAPALPERVIGGVAGFGVLWLIAFGYRWVRGRAGMGGGDPKLFGAIGLWLGWRLLPAVLLIAALVGLGVALLMRLRGRTVAADTALPFGALLAVAAYPAWLVMIRLAP